MNKVLVIGDACLDIFVYGRCERLSPEAPVPVFLPERTTKNTGMALNVVENLKALGCDVETWVNPLGTLTKTRYVDSTTNQMLLRVDEEGEVKKRTLEPNAHKILKNFEAVVIADYNKGFVSKGLIKEVSMYHPHVFLDTKKHLDKSWCEKVFLVKINEKESMLSQSYVASHREQVIVTLGSQGCVWKDKKIPTHAAEVQDVSGAGDTFMAALVSQFLATKDIEQSCKFANRCATSVVSKRGVSVVDPYSL